MYYDDEPYRTVHNSMPVYREGYQARMRGGGRGGAVEPPFHVVCIQAWLIHPCDLIITYSICIYVWKIRLAPTMCIAVFLKPQVSLFLYRLRYNNSVTFHVTCVNSSASTMHLYKP